jgi:hypothetical protein
MMTHEKQRIAIAKACGWKREWMPDAGWVIYRPDGSVCYSDPDPKADWETHRLPDYLNDLNAMHEAEKMLTHEQEKEYAYQLEAACCPREYGWHATASQRSAPYIKVLGLWEEDCGEPGAARL